MHSCRENVLHSCERPQNTESLPSFLIAFFLVDDHDDDDRERKLYELILAARLKPFFLRLKQ